MHDAFAVGGVQGIGNLNTEFQYGFDFQRLSRNQMLESVSLQQFHRDEGSLLALVNFVDSADVGMVKSGRGTGLAPKSFQSLGIVSYFFGQELQGHEPAKASVLGLIHNPHAAATELLNDAVVRDGLADHPQACYGGN